VYKKLSVIGTFFIGLVFPHAPGFAQTKDTSIIIQQSEYFKVAPAQVYSMLLSSAEFSASTKKSFDVFSATSAKIE
jgi:hypothetical protein